MIACSRAGLDSRNADGIDPALLRSSLDWDRVAEIAREHRVAPLLFRSLQLLPASPASNEALQSLKQLYLATAARNAVLFRSLRGIFEALAEVGIPSIVLKGAMLADTVYRDRALRPMNDIDLLIREEDLEEAETGLKGVGYEATHDAEAKRNLRLRHHHWLFRTAAPVADGIPLELHWRLHPPGWPFRVDIRQLWKRAIPTRVAGVPALALAPEDLLLHLCTHLSRHRFDGRLIALCDVAVVISRFGGGIDWPVLAERAAEWRAAPYVSVALRLAAELSGADVPASTMARLTHNDDRTLFDLARERILEEKGKLRAAAELRLRWQRSGSKERVAALRRALSPDVDRRKVLERLFRRYLPLSWSLVRNPGAVAAIARREAGKSQLDSWCSPHADGDGGRPLSDRANRPG